MPVSKSEVDRVAKLARLNFEEEEKEELVEELNKILEYVEKLNELDTKGIKDRVNPYYIENKFREDIVEPSMSLEEVLKNAPYEIEGYIMVPKVVE